MGVLKEPSKSYEQGVKDGFEKGVNEFYNRLKNKFPDPWLNMETIDTSDGLISIPVCMDIVLAELSKYPDID